MSRHFPLLVLLLVITPFITLHETISPYLAQQASAHQDQPPATESAVAESDKPDFNSIESLPERKTQFFDFIEQFVAQRNKEILELRTRLQKNEVNPEELKALAERYRVKAKDPQDIRQRLLKKVDVVPVSLVLAQAALESAWGTSRFAATGNNFFGQWCFTEGCGLVPDRRHEGMNHEVMAFETPFDSVASYMRNLNSHPAYKHFRDKRAELRAQRQPLNGCYLAQGLTNYSAKGDAYVESIKLLIRANRLERDPAGYCTPVAVAKEEPETPVTPEPPKKQTLAVDQIQGSAEPVEQSDQPPSG